MSFPFRAVLVLAAASAACLTAAGCGGGGDPLAGMPAKQVAQKAISDLKTGPAFSMAGTGADSGSRISVHLSYKQGTGCEGTIGEGADGGLTMVVIGLNA